MKKTLFIIELKGKGKDQRKISYMHLFDSFYSVRWYTRMLRNAYVFTARLAFYRI